jgi:hypothetical protein
MIRRSITIKIMMMIDPTKKDPRDKERGRTRANKANKNNPQTGEREQEHAARDSTQNAKSCYEFPRFIIILI